MLNSGIKLSLIITKMFIYKWRLEFLSIRVGNVVGFVVVVDVGFGVVVVVGACVVVVVVVFVVVVVVVVVIRTEAHV